MKNVFYYADGWIDKVFEPVRPNRNTFFYADGNYMHLIHDLFIHRHCKMHTYESHTIYHPSIGIENAFHIERRMVKYIILSKRNAFYYADG